MDLGRAIGQPALDDLATCYVIITEYNRSTQGFLVRGVDRIMNLNWDEIHPPPRGSGNNYMTAVTRVDDELVEIIDVEKVLAEVIPANETVTASLVDESRERIDNSHHVLVVDDSSVARNQIKRTLDQVGIQSTLAKNGRDALEILKAWAQEGQVSERISLVISDIEMPEMDGYTLTTEIRSDPRLQDLYVLLHTSLSGVFNNALVEKVGANEFIPKFRPDELATAVLKRVEAVQVQRAAR
jgi:two-component system chemotaxis response regulator CheV